MRSHRSKRGTNPLNQTAVYWGTPAADGYGGYTFDEPAELTVRWEKVQKQFTDPQGEEKLSQAVVYLAQDVDVGGMLYLGTLADLGSAEEAAPLTVAGTYRIAAFEKIPDTDGETYVRRAWLGVR